MDDIEKVIKDLEFCVNGHFKVELSLATKILALLKEQEAVELKTGHWIYKKYDDLFMCSCCEMYSIRNDYPYCHWCGAKMEGR